MSNYRTTIPKRIFSAALAIVFLFSCMQFKVSVSYADENAADKWDGTSADVTWYTQHIGEQKFTISKAAELAGLAKLVNDGTADFANKTITLASDIDLNGNASSGQNVWSPIGRVFTSSTELGDSKTIERCFLGKFDGGGHSIYGIYVNNENRGSGFFGCAAGNTEIKNITVYGTIISGDLSAGGIVGYVPYQSMTASIENCVNNCDIISSAGHAGGIIGYNGGCDVKRCINNGDVKVTAVSGNTGAGGVVGTITCAEVKECVNNGDIIVKRGASGEDDLNMICAGGIIGLMNSAENDIKVSDCYNRGDVSSESVRELIGNGGIVGKNDKGGTVRNCYSTGDITGAAGLTGGITGTNTETEKTVHSNTYYLENTVNKGNGGIAGDAGKDGTNGTSAKSSSELKAIAATLGELFAADLETPVNDGYPVLKWQLDESTLPGTDPETGWDGKKTDVSWYEDNKTEVSFTINTPEQLAGFAELVNGGTESFKGKTVSLGANIDLNGKDWTPVGKQVTSAYSANETNSFAGKFDGAGHVITNFTVGQKYAGFFAYLLPSAEITGLGIDNAKIVNTADSSSGMTGGIAAVLKNDSSGAPKITNCWTGKNVKVTGEKCYAGGIAGASSNSGSSYKVPAISGCVNNADVTGIRAGGIIGNGMSEISDCYNAGTIFCSGTMMSHYSGGIAGYTDTSSITKISDSYNIGTILHCSAGSAAEKTGAIAGLNKAVFSNSYYLKDSAEGKAAGGNAVNNVVELSSDMLKASGASLLNAERTDIWLTDESLNNGYPVLAWQKNTAASAPSIKELKISQPPAKTEYGEGEYADLSDMTVSLSYTDGSEKALDHYSIKPDPSLMLTTAVSEFNITCSGFSTVQPITVKGAVGIRIAQSPDKTKYITGETFNTAGMKVELVYSDGSAAEISDYTTSPTTSAALKGSDKTVKISFGEYSTEQNIRVRTPIALRITQQPEKTEYKVGEYFKRDGIKVCAELNDGTLEELDLNKISCKPTSKLNASDEKTGISVTCSDSKYKNLEPAVCSIKVMAPEKLEITTPPNKTVYAEGEKFSSEGMTVNAVYANGEKTELSKYDYSIAGSSAKLSSDVKSVTISYQGLEVEQAITVDPKGDGERRLIVEKSSSFAASYREGDYVSSSYIIVKYVPGTSEDEAVTLTSSDYTYSPKYFEGDTKEITVSYGGLTGSVAVNVEKAESLSATGFTSDVFSPGDTVPDKATLKLNFSDGKTVTVRSGYTRIPDLNTPVTSETTELKFKYGDHECTLPITVKEKVAEIKASLKPGVTEMPATVELSTATEGATIYYNTDGSSLRNSKQEYTGPIEITGDTVIQAYAVKEGMTDSNTVNEPAKFVYVAKGMLAPVMSDTEQGIFKDSVQIQLSTEAEDALIYYTTDGSAPSDEKTLYEGSITLTATTVIKAVAVKEGFLDSETATFEYTKEKENSSSGGSSGTGGGSSGKPSSPAAPTTPTTPAVPEQPSTSSGGTLDFEDVAAGSWYYDAVKYAYEKGLMNGTGNKTFTPQGGVTRGMFVTVLGRLGVVDTSAYKTSGFSDVKQGMYYEPYIAWAKEKNIVNGTGADKFSPDRMITRQEMAVIINNYLKATGADVSADADTSVLSAFGDKDKIASWAKDGVSNCVEKDLLKGKNGGIFDPEGTATRAELAVLLQRLA